MRLAVHSQVLCVNESVRSLGSLPLINERCMDLQTQKAKGCKAAEVRKWGGVEGVSRLEGLETRLTDLKRTVFIHHQLARFQQPMPYCWHKEAGRQLRESGTVVHFM